MPAVPHPPNEGARLDALEHYGVLDTPGEPVFDRLAELSALLFEAPIAIVGFIDAKRHWFKGTHGVSARENSRENAFCSYTVLTDQVLCVSDTSLDERFKNIPPVTKFNIRYYAGAPLVTVEGFRIGTVCIFDFKPRDLLSPEDQSKLKYLAQLAMGELEHRRSKPPPLNPGLLDMVERFLLSSPSPIHQAALEVAALVRMCDQVILNKLVLNSDAQGLLEWLSTLSFFQIEGDRVFPHDSIRQALRKTLLTHHPERYLELLSKAKVFYTEQIKRSSGTALQHWLFDDVFLHRHHEPVYLPEQVA